MKIVSWNIASGRHGLDNIINQLKELDADIIGLQEVKETIENGQRNNLAHVIAQKLGYHSSFCLSFTTDRHQPPYSIGNAILSREKPLSFKCHFLSTIEEYRGSAETEPRTAIEAIFPFKDSQLHVYSTHLGYSKQFVHTDLRFKQVKKLIACVPASNSILMGDFNSLPDSPVVAALSTHLHNPDSSKEPSHIEHSENPPKEYRIDYIFASKDLQTSNFMITKTVASDHYPLSVNIST